ncbi:MAG: hypothetical protein CL917_15020 [Deltaproteobacteria bacterium]|nr:hypothetical protein [Deltaproteobacteria bacterium]
MRRTLSTQKVVDCAASIADEHGIQSVTLTRVAQSLGVRQPALYRHVRSHEALIRALGLRGMTLLASCIGEAAVGRAGEDAVRAIGWAWLKMAHDHPGLYAATSQCSQSPKEADEALSGTHVVEILAQSLTAYRMKEAERKLAARSIQSAFHGFAQLESQDKDISAPEIQDAFEIHLEILCCGINKVSLSDSGQ